MELESIGITAIFLCKLSLIRSSLNVTVPPQIRSRFLDRLDLTQKHQADTELIPPLKLRHVIGQDDNFALDRAWQLIEYCGLKPCDAVLDVGCGVGSMARSLVHYLDSQGRYEGFDINKEFIDWLQKNITQKHPNFRFKHVDIWNSNYNAKGKIVASKFKFPYESDSFDVVFLGSVFTHMLPMDLENYLSEITRVLKPNGKSLVTYFLLTPERQNLTDDKLRTGFMDTGMGYSVTNRAVPEEAVAYKQEYILNLYKKNNLKIIPPIKYGNLQDAIVAKKSSF